MTAVEQAPDAVLTPTVRTAVRRIRFWVGAALLVLVVVVITSIATGGARGGAPLAADNAAPAGAKAVVEVLRSQGVNVVATASLDETRAAIDGPATVIVIDSGYLDAGQWVQVRDLAQRVIVVQPAFLELQSLAPQVAQAGSLAPPLAADCSLGAVQRAGTVSGPASGYRLIADAPDAVTCLGSDDRFALISLPTETGELLVLGASGALSNEWVGLDGNAAFALALLGQHETLVWYRPTMADVDPGQVPPTAGELTPSWVVPVLVLLLAVFIAAAMWRGRRFGPLVVENLPVTPRASETMHGRARLYQRSASRLRALDALRIGALERIAADCGLPRTTSVDEVIVAVVAVTGRPEREVRELLVDAVPHSDAELVDRSDALALLERAVRAAVRPG